MKKKKSFDFRKTSSTNEAVVPQRGKVDEMTDQNFQIEGEVDCKCLMVIIRILQHLPRKGLPLREHDDLE